MNDQKKHQKLIELESMTTSLLNNLTNQAYALKKKFGYRVSFEKGTQAIEANIDGKLAVTKDYYIFRFYIIDKTDSPIGVEIDLLINYYPKRPLVSVNALHEFALNEFYLNALRCLFNNTYADYVTKNKQADNREKEQVHQEMLDEIIEKAGNKPLLFVP